MVNNGFSKSNFLIASMGVLLVAFGWGYILATDLLAPKRDIDERLTHLSREILHELNIPLSTIKANSAMLQKNLTNKKSLKRLERIDSASIRLLKLYEELLYSIHKEIHTIPKESFLLESTIVERVDILKEFGRNPFDISIDKRVLYADKIGFEQMVDNLLNNAMKYSPKESLITIKTEDSRLLIIDRGMGIDESILVKIFERYYQADRDKNGEGIGLALVKSYCDENSIAITIHSTRDSGTTVSLDLEGVIC